MTTDSRESGLPSPRISLRSKVAILVRLAQETLRMAFVPLRLLFYLPRHKAWKQRTRELLGTRVDPTEFASANDAARARFRRCLGDEPPRHVFVSCAEHSGEGHARTLVADLRSRHPDVELVGFGGRDLEGDGVRLLANLVDDAVIGFQQAVARLPFFMKVMARYLDYLRETPPDLVVLLDSPGLHMVLAEEAKRRGIPVLYYICPQFWAWAPWRLHRFRRCVDGAISILPFERPMFEEQGVPIGFAGNPLADRLPDLAPEPREPILALLPGSRSREIERHFLPMLKLFRSFRATHPEARAIVPQKSPRHMERIRKALTEAAAAGQQVEGVELVEGGVFSVMPRARAAIVKSGTSTLQTALCRTPQVVVYRVTGPVQKWLRPLLTTPWVAGPNLVLGRDAVPEHVFDEDEEWKRIQAEIEALWDDGEARRAQLEAADEIARRVAGNGSTAEAVRWILP